jgi:hypothetical protein
MIWQVFDRRIFYAVVVVEGEERKLPTEDVYQDAERLLVELGRGILDASFTMIWRSLFLAVVLVLQTGCVQSVLGVLLAPEAVVGAAAGGAANAGAETLSGLSLDQVSQSDATVMEIDRILKENPNAANADRLRELRENMKGTPKSTGPDQRIATPEPPPPRRPMNKNMPVRKGDLLSVSLPSQHIPERRPPMRPLAQPSSTTIIPEVKPVHTMSLYPVRVK